MAANSGDAGASVRGTYGRLARADQERRSAAPLVIEHPVDEGQFDSAVCQSYSLCEQKAHHERPRQRP